MRLYKGFMKSSSKYFQSNFQKSKTWLLLEHYFKWIITLLRSSVWDCSCQEGRHLSDLHSLKYDFMVVQKSSQEDPDIFALLVSYHFFLKYHILQIFSSLWSEQICMWKSVTFFFLQNIITQFLWVADVADYLGIWSSIE